MKRLLLLLLLLLPSVVLADPAITSTTGTLVHNSTLTINGNGFGTKTVAAPFRYDDFENGTLGNLIAGPYLNDGAERYSNFTLRPNSTRSVEVPFLGDGGCGGDFSSNIYATASNLNTLYIDAWYWGRYSNPASRNHKLYRIHSNFNLSPNLYFNVYCGANSVHMDQDDEGGDDRSFYFDLPGGAMNYLNGKWTHLQGYFKHSVGNNPNGIMRVWVDNVKYEDVNWQNSPDDNTHWDAVFYGNYLGHGSEGACPTCAQDSWTYWDNVYTDTTQAHVEIGNAPTYDTCTLREVQIPTAWSTSAINITLNQGEFASFSGKYLYVTDAGGLVNTGGFALSDTSGPPPTCASVPGGGGGPPANIQYLQSAPVAVLGAASTGSSTFTIDLTAPSKIIVQIDNGVGGGPRTVSSVTKLSGTATIGSFSAAGSGFTWGATRRNETWRADVTGSGTATIQVTMSASTDFSFVASEFSGLATIAQGDVDVSGGATATSAGPASVSLVTTNANDLLVGAMGHGNAAVSLTSGSGYTLLGESESSTFMPIHAEYQVVSTTGTKNVTVSLGGSVTWGIYGVSFKAAP